MSGKMSIIKTSKQLTIEDVKKQALDVLLHQGQHGPALLANGTEGIAYIPFADIPEEPEAKSKYQFLKGVALFNVKEIGNLTVLYFVMEAWVGGNLKFAPSSDPQRQEILSITSLDVRTKRLI